MHPQDRIAPAHRSPHGRVPVHFGQIGLGPDKGIGRKARREIGLCEPLGRQMRDPGRFRIARIGRRDFAHEQHPQPVKQSRRALRNLPLQRSLGDVVQGLVRQRAPEIRLWQQTLPRHQRNLQTPRRRGRNKHRPVQSEPAMLARHCHRRVDPAERRAHHPHPGRWDLGFDQSGPGRHEDLRRRIGIVGPVMPRRQDHMAEEKALSRPETYPQVRADRGDIGDTAAFPHRHLMPPCPAVLDHPLQAVAKPGAQQ